MIRLCVLTAVLACSVQSAAGSPSIQGSVVDQTGAALAGVHVVVRDAQGKVAAVARSDTRGKFMLELPQGDYRLSAALRGFAPAEQKFEARLDQTPELTVVMQIPRIEDQVVVTASRTDTPVAQLGSSVTVLSGDQLRREGVVWLAEALRRVPGLTIAQSGGYGQLASLFIRGGESDYAKVLIDGIPVNDPGGAFNFGMLPLSGIDRIEVVRGPQSALFGSDAIAGVIQIFTARGASETGPGRFSGSIEGGNHSSFRYSGAVQGSGERWDYAASFSRADTDGDVVNGSFNSEAATVNVGLRAFRNGVLRFTVRSDAGRTGVPGPWAFHRPEQDEYFSNRGIAGGVSFVHQATQRLAQTISYSVYDSRQLSVDPGDSGSFISSYQGRTAPFTSYDYPFTTLNESRRQRVGYQADLLAGTAHQVSAGADYERESGVVGDPAADPLRAVRDNAGVFVQDQFSHGERIFTTAGIRFEHNASFGFFAAPRVSMAFHVRRPGVSDFWGITKLKANFGIGVKEPTLLESFSNSPFFRGNPGLRPEKSRSFDAGIEQYFGSGRGSLELTWFENRFRDQIGFAITDYASFEGSFFNIGRSRARGLEAGGVCPLPHRFEMSARYTLLDSRVLDSAVDTDPAFAVGRELFRRPRHSGYLEVRWMPERWILSASALLVGSRVDSDFSGLGLDRNPGYGTLNLSATYSISKFLSLYVAVNNALNRAYMDVLGFPALPAHFRVGLRAGLK